MMAQIIQILSRLDELSDDQIFRDIELFLVHPDACAEFIPSDPNAFEEKFNLYSYILAIIDYYFYYFMVVTFLTYLLFSST